MPRSVGVVSTGGAAAADRVVGVTELIVEYYSRDSPPPARYVIRGADDEPLRSALLAALPPGEGAFCVAAPNDEGEQHWAFVVDGRVTIGQTSEFTGGLALPVDRSGRGGGLLPGLWDAIMNGVELYAVLEAYRHGGDKVREFRYRSTRRAAGEWVDEGTDSDPSLALRQFVKTRAEWLRADFDTVFGLSRESGSTLLRMLGYRKVQSRPDVWLEKSEAG